MNNMTNYPDVNTYANVKNVSVDWHLDDADAPELCVEFAEETVPFSYIEKNISNGTILVGISKGLIDHGLFYHKLYTGTKSKLSIKKTGIAPLIECRPFHYVGYEEILPQVASMHVLCEHNKAFKANIKGIEGAHGQLSLTLGLTKRVVAPLLAEREIFLLLVTSNNTYLWSDSGIQLQIMPSYSPTEIVLPKGSEWKQEALDSLYTVVSKL